MQFSNRKVYKGEEIERVEIRVINMTLRGTHALGLQIYEGGIKMAEGQGDSLPS